MSNRQKLTRFAIRKCSGWTRKCSVHEVALECLSCPLADTGASSRDRLVGVWFCVSFVRRRPRPIALTVRLLRRCGPRYYAWAERIAAGRGNGDENFYQGAESCIHICVAILINTSVGLAVARIRSDSQAFMGRCVRAVGRARHKKRVWFCDCGVRGA